MRLEMGTDIGFSNLGLMIKEGASKYKGRTAIIFGDKLISYEGLDELSDRFCAGLVKLGIKKQECVALLLFNIPEFVIAYFGILKAGATVVPINTMLKSEEIKFILEDSQSVAIITSLTFVDIARQLRLRIEHLKEIILVSKSRLTDTIAYEELLMKGQTDTMIREVEKSDIATIMYTSGTTGKPKGAMLTHYNLISNAASSMGAIKVSVKDNFLCILPLFHSFAATVCMITPLMCGARLTLIVSPRPFKRALRTIFRKRVTVLAGVPSIFNILADAKLPMILTLPLVSRFINPLRICISGAAALPVETLKKFQRRVKIPLLEGYGLTEASPVVSSNPMKGKRKAGSIGLPFPGIEVAVVDDSGRKVTDGSVGELIVRGPNVMKGYLNQPQATRETIKDGWLYTGDLVKMDEDGYIYIVGRKKEMIIVRGFNVYPREIEEVLYQHPWVKEAAVIGVPDQHKGEVPKGFVVLKESLEAFQRLKGIHTLDEVERELSHFLKDRLAAYKIPRRIEIKESLPKNATGKILKRCLS